MTNIFDLTKEYNKRSEKKWWITLAEQEFLSNIDVIKGIKNSPWYELIKKYWWREFIDSISFLRDVDSSKSHEVARAQARLDLAQRFTAYLNWHENS